MAVKRAVFRAFVFRVRRRAESFYYFCSLHGRILMRFLTHNYYEQLNRKIRSITIGSQHFGSNPWSEDVMGRPTAFLKIRYLTCVFEAHIL